MILAVLLMQTGFHLVDLSRNSFAEFIMLLSFWGGFSLMLCLLIGVVARLFVPENGEEFQAGRGGRDDGAKPPN